MLLAPFLWLIDHFVFKFSHCIQSLHHTAYTDWHCPVRILETFLPLSQVSVTQLAADGGDGVAGGGGGARQLYLPPAGSECPHKAGSLSAGICGSVRSQERMQ